MSATTALLRGRAKAEALMLDTCTITRVTGTSTNRETGVITPTTTTVYSGQCKVQQRAASASPSDVGEAARLSTRLELHLPASTTGVRPDDRATITASANDAELVGRVFVVRSSPHKSFLTARRLEVEELTS